MLKKKYRIKKETDFRQIFKEGEKAINSFIFLKFKKNDLSITRFGFSVGKKVSNKAVLRNKIKRILNQIIKKELDRINPGFDVVVVVSNKIINKDHTEIKAELDKLLKKTGIL